MNSNEIVKHNFEREKNELKSLANTVVNEVRLSRVKEEAGPFDLFNHDVSGKEMNQFVNEVQTLFIDSNKTLSTIYSCLYKVYSTFDFLDSEYLKSIIASMKVGENNTEEVKNAQKEIERIIQGLNITVEKLEKFKLSANEKLKTIESINVEKIKQWELYQDHVQEWIESCKHFWNVDETYSDVQELKKKVLPITVLKKDVCDLKEMILNENDKIDKLESELDAIKDKLLSFTEECSDVFANIKQDVIKLGVFDEKLQKLDHLNDVDDLWCVCQNLSNQITQVRNDQIALFEKKEKLIKCRMFFSYGIAIVAIIISVCSFVI